MNDPITPRRLRELRALLVTARADVLRRLETRVPFDLFFTHEAVFKAAVGVKLPQPDRDTRIERMIDMIDAWLGGGQ